MSGEAFDRVARTWGDYALGGLLDGVVALAVAWMGWRVLQKSLTPGVGWWLFALVLLKCVVPLPQTLPFGVATGAPSEPVVILENEGWIRGGEYSSNSSVNNVPPEEKSAPFPWRQGVFFTYLGLAVIGIARVAGLVLRTHGFVKRARELPGGAPFLHLDKVCQQLGIRGGVDVKMSREISSPAIWTLGRPVLLLPEGLLEELHPSYARWVVAHECAHLRRGDGLSLLILRLARAVFFYHPVVWLTGRLMEELAEQECDRLATEASHQQSAGPAESLLAVTEWAARHRGTDHRMLTPGLSASGRSLKRRLQKLLQTATARPLTVGGLVAIGTAVAVIVPSFRGSPQREELERRVTELERQLAAKSVREQQVDQNITRARQRHALDTARLSVAAVRELELNYQALKKISDPGDASLAMKQLIRRFPQANRAGCCALYLARLLPAGEERDGWLDRCIGEWSDCYYLDGTSVGALARRMRAGDLEQSGQESQASTLISEIRRDFPGATGFGGIPLFDN